MTGFSLHSFWSPTFGAVRTSVRDLDRPNYDTSLLSLVVICGILSPLISNGAFQNQGSLEVR